MGGHKPDPMGGELGTERPRRRLRSGVGGHGRGSRGGGEPGAAPSQPRAELTPFSARIAPSERGAHPWELGAISSRWF